MNTQRVQWQEVLERSKNCVWLAMAVEYVQRGMSVEQAMTYAALALSKELETVTSRWLRSHSKQVTVLQL